MSWADVATCMSFGIPVQYLMMHGIFMAPGATPPQVAYYNELLDKVRALPEWQRFMNQGAFNQTVLKGEAFANWLDRADRFHLTLMREAKFKAPLVPVTPAPATPGGRPATPR